DSIILPRALSSRIKGQNRVFVTVYCYRFQTAGRNRLADDARELVRRGGPPAFETSTIPVIDAIAELGKNGRDVLVMHHAYHGMGVWKITHSVKILDQGGNCVRV